MKCIRTYDDPFKAQCDKELLESEGLLTYLKNEHSVNAYPVNALGGIELHVEENNTARALEIIGPDISDPETVFKITKRLNFRLKVSGGAALLSMLTCMSLTGFNAGYTPAYINTGIAGGAITFMLFIAFGKNPDPDDRSDRDR